MKKEALHDYLIELSGFGWKRYEQSPETVFQGIHNYGGVNFTFEAAINHHESKLTLTAYQGRNPDAMAEVHKYGDYSKLTVKLMWQGLLNKVTDLLMNSVENILQGKTPRTSPAQIAYVPIKVSPSGQILFRSNWGWTPAQDDEYTTKEAAYVVTIRIPERIVPSIESEVKENA